LNLLGGNAYQHIGVFQEKQLAGGERCHSRGYFSREKKLFVVISYLDGHFCFMW